MFQRNAGDAVSLLRTALRGDAPIRRITTPDIPIPFNISMMNAVVPSADRISQQIKGILAY